MKRDTISFFGNFGTQNLGNEYTLQAIMHNVRRFLPDARMNCICPDPRDASARYGVAAVQMSHRFAKGPTPGVRRGPNVLPLRWARRLLIGVPLELMQWLRAFRALKGTRMLVMTGTGMLGDFGISPFGLHWEILRWSLAARARRCKVLFVSVGAGPIHHALSRRIVKSAISLAEYRSYRDDFSRAYLASIGFNTNGDFVYPDLAFSLPPEMASSRPRNGRSQVVGLGLMDYYGGGPSPERSGEATYQDYLDKVTRFAAWLLDRDYTVRLLIGDLTYDTRITRDVRRLLQERGVKYREGQIIDEPVSSVEEFIAQLATTDLLVATRFHSIVLALMLNKPVLALAYHEKLVSLMGGVGMADYCQSIDHLDVDRLEEQFIKLEQNSEVLRPLIQRRMEEYRRDLDEQYARVFEDLGAASPRGRLRVAEAAEAAVGWMARARILGRSPLGAYLRLNERLFERLPRTLLARRPVSSYGHFLHYLVRLHAKRQMYLGTFFVRNRPELELIRRLSVLMGQGRSVKIAVLGASNGAEVYSITWAVRSAHLHLELAVQAVDISAEALKIARRGVYSLGVSELVNEPIFERLTEDEMEEMFDSDGDQLAVKPWLKEGIAWHAGDAGEPHLLDALGPQDIVVANRFLCHMSPPDAERCLRNIARWVAPGGYLFVSGIDLNVRTKVAKDLGWRPLPDLMEEIHDGDPSLRVAWPCKYWGLEPLNRMKPDWRIRYASAFQLGGDRRSMEETARRPPGRRNLVPPASRLVHERP